MISASKSTLSLSNLKLLRPKVTENLTNLPITFVIRYSPKAWMFLMPVAVFVILYSVPRFFELETKFVSRSLCATVSTILMSNDTLNFTTTLEQTSNDDIEDDIMVTSLNGSDFTSTTPASTGLSTTEPCPTVWEPELGVKPLRFNKYYVSVRLPIL